MTERTGVLGIFVGGASSRMGRPKGLLPAPGSGEPLVVRLVGAGRGAGLVPVLVGDATPYSEIVPDVPRLSDQPTGMGPLGGLNAVLTFADPEPVVTLACDMPRVDADALATLLAAPPAVVVAPRPDDDAPWQPFFARWDPPAVAPILKTALGEGVRSFQALFARLDASVLQVGADLAARLVDWDTPTDIG